MANVKNYTEQGGEKTVIGGTLDVTNGTVTGLDATADKKGLVKKAATVAAVTPAGDEPTAVETAVNGILTALKNAGIMVADA